MYIYIYIIAAFLLFSFENQVVIFVFRRYGVRHASLPDLHRRCNHDSQKRVLSEHLHTDPAGLNDVYTSVYREPPASPTLRLNI